MIVCMVPTLSTHPSALSPIRLHMPICYQCDAEMECRWREDIEEMTRGNGIEFDSSRTMVGEVGRAAQ